MKFESFAHGRVALFGVNQIGGMAEATSSLILSMATPQRVSLRLERKAEPLITVESESGESRYPALVAAASQLLKSEGHRVLGFDLKVSSSIPQNSGLASSAALTVALVKVLRSAYDLRLTDVEVAAVARRTEEEVFGIKCALGDSLTSALLRPGEALLLDNSDQQFDRVSLPLEAADFAVIDSGLAVDTEKVNARLEECAEVLRVLEVKSFRDPSVESRLSLLAPTLAKRVAHVLSENLRVREFVGALRARDTKKLGQLFFASQKSEAENFEFSTPEIEALIKICKDELDIFGARLTGSGKHLAVVLITKPRRATALAEGVLRAYQAKFPALKPRILI